MRWDGMRWFLHGPPLHGPHLHGPPLRHLRHPRRLGTVLVFILLNVYTCDTYVQLHKYNHDIACDKWRNRRGKNRNLVLEVEGNECGGGLVAKTRCGNSWINGVGISTNPRDEEGKAIGGGWDSTTRQKHERQWGKKERNPETEKTVLHPYTRMPEKRNETAERGRSGTPPPTSPVLITNSQKWNAGPPCHQHCKATALEGAAGKCPTKGAKVWWKGRPLLSREREKGFLFQETRHSKTQQDTIQQDTIQKNKTRQPLQTIDKLDDALGLAKCSQEISFTPLSPCSNSWENKETK